MRTGGESEHQFDAGSPLQGRNERVLVPRSLSAAGNGANRTSSEFE